MKHVYPEKRNPTFLESKIIYEYYIQKNIYIYAQDNGITELIIATLTTINMLTQILGYTPEEKPDYIDYNRDLTAAELHGEYYSNEHRNEVLKICKYRQEMLKLINVIKDVNERHIRE